MKSEEIRKARKKYTKMQKEKEKLIALKEELKQLQDDPKVKRYLDIIHVEDKNILDEEQIIRYSFSTVDKSDDDLKMYLYMGAFAYACCFDESDNMVLFDVNEADYFLYCNIADEYDSIQVKPSNKEYFEKENIVFKPKSVISAESKYYELQRVYYEYLLKGDLRKKGKILEKIKEHL